ncbi:serine/threonine-protein kinase [Nocardia huaxiensis]|uniref:non-specific serine/threonine protein kinase n=1 Tax=Nocardia huaxiensis TaxID=2755382 RepID=A0A7D6Z6K1_9NOCA|nr:serine/threonine-protein kinase [Nocardia huaxiensis]QLY32884.1 protein kinase [Nocardia huaxiensis]UFS93359.1 protein kinase [Nocardia huaxiensis]
MLRAGEVFAGYVIERELGRGGMGSVYLAQHPRLPRRTALKLLNRELFDDTEIRARFDREADLVARLEHPHIVPVYDRGIEGDRRWISMRYIDGCDAASLEPLEVAPDRALRIITSVAQALDFAHRNDVLHRDVKPANILLERDVAEERVYLADFGIARLRDDSARLTQTGTVTATLAYAAPEQLAGLPVDHRCDQYALACTLYWLLTGTTPFAGDNAPAIIAGHLHREPPPLNTFRRLPPALDAVLARGLAKNPAARFDSCAEFAAAARQAAGGVSAPMAAGSVTRPRNGHSLPPVGAVTAPSGARPPTAGGPNGTRPASPPSARPMSPASPVRQATPVESARPLTPQQPGRQVAQSAPARQFTPPGSGVPASSDARPPLESATPARVSGRSAAVRNSSPARPAAPGSTGPRATPPPVRRKRRSWKRGCLIGTVGIVVAPVLVVAGCLAVLDAVSSDDPGGSGVTTTAVEPAPYTGDAGQPGEAVVPTEAPTGTTTVETAPEPGHYGYTVTPGAETGVPATRTGVPVPAPGY